MQSPNENSSVFSIAKWHSGFCEGHLTCIQTVSQILVPYLVLLVQPPPHTTFALPPVANDNTFESKAPGGRHISKPLTRFHLIFLFSSSRSRQLHNLLFQNCCFLNVLSWRVFLAQPTVIHPSRYDCPINTSTPTKSVQQQPLLTEAVITNASSRITTHSPIRRSDHFFPVCYAAAPSISGMPPLNTSSRNDSRANYRTYLDLKRRTTQIPQVNRLKHRSLQQKRLHTSVQGVADSISDRSENTMVQKPVISSR